MEKPRIGVYVCWCGTNISKMVDVNVVTEAIKEMPHVVVAKNYKYMCSDPGQELIVNDIREQQLDRIVVAACSPRIHELTFRKALENAGLNPYLFQMANIREHVSWVHTDRKLATQKAISLISAAVNRVGFHEELDKRSVEINPATLVIGGGIAGISASLELAAAGKQVFLVEKESKLGGIVSQLDLLFPHMHSAKELLNPMVQELTRNKNIKVLLNSTIRDVSGYVGNFTCTVSKGKNELEKVLVGNIIVATGLKSFNPSVIENYAYGKLPDVITSLEFEKMLRSGKISLSSGEIPRNIAIIHCVGSRNEEYHPYCSRTCCLTGVKYAHQISNALPDSQVYELYADMRTFGKHCEEFYTRTSGKNILFLMYNQKASLPLIQRGTRENGNHMNIRFREVLSGEDVEIAADLVILMVAMEGHKDSREVAHTVGVSKCGDDFFIEKHPKLDPVATTTDGVYIVGSCQSPKDIPDSISQAKAASARVLSTIARGKVEVELTTAVVNEEICCGCQTCISVCPYSAISFKEDLKVSTVNEILCKGCGTCASACPTGAIKTRHFTDLQILSQIEGLFTERPAYNELLELKEI